MKLLRLKSKHIKGDTPNMAKKSQDRSERPGRIEIQRGPINLDEQFTQGFSTREQTTFRDTMNMEARRYFQTMDLHTPKR